MKLNFRSNNIIRIETTVNINYDTWVNQVGRFTKGNELQVLKRNHPENTESSGKAIIEIELLTPLLDGFNANIRYIQTFSNLLSSQDSNGNDIQIINNEKLVLIDYIQSIGRIEMDDVLNQVDQLVDTNLKDLNRVQAKLPIAIIANIVLKNTFNGLKQEKYTYTVVQ